MVLYRERLSEGLACEADPWAQRRIKNHLGRWRQRWQEAFGTKGY
jgi:hypothetical protein